MKIRPINIDEIDEVDITKIVPSNRHSYDNKGLFKYFIGYIHMGNVFLAPLCIKLPQMNGYVKYLDNNNECIS